MKFREIFRFELAYQVRRPWTWLFLAVLIVLSFLMTRDGSVSEVLYADFFLNSSFAIAKTTVFGSVVWLVMAAAIAGDAAARDMATGMHPLIYTTPVTKAAYLSGRFLAALTINALILLGVQAGILLGVYLPGVDAELIGPFRPAAFLTAYAFIAVPNAIFATVLQFSLAAVTRRTMASYFASFVIIFIGFFVASMLLFQRGAGTLLDPIGIRFIVEDIAHLWTPFEKNWRVLALDGIVLTNRLLWLSIALVVLAITYFRFRFAHHTSTNWWRRFKTRAATIESPGLAGIGVSAINPVLLPEFPQTFGFILHLRQGITIAWTSFRSIVTSWAGLAMLLIIPVLTVVVVLDQMQSNGVPLLPVTAAVIRELTGSLSDELSRWVIVPFLIVFFAGELVWREREAGLGEIHAAMPGSEWTQFLGKFLALGLLLIVFMTTLMAAGMLAQVIMNYHHFELDLYLKILFGLQLTEYLLFAMLALAVHVIVNHKYLGHLVAIIAFVYMTLASLFGVEHNLLIYGAGPGWSYTEISGFGSSLQPWFWFKLYWTGWALLLASVAKLFLVRGKETDLKVRFQLAGRRLRGSTAWTAGLALVLILTIGAFIFYNTNVLNEYITACGMKARAADYERQYGRYAKSLQPAITKTILRVEIYPEERALTITGSYYLVNRWAKAIDSIHLALEPAIDVPDVTFDNAAGRVHSDKKLGHQIYHLTRALQPGDSILLMFRMHVKRKGFRESGADASVIPNGTNFTNAWLPHIGYQTSRELVLASDRRAHRLAPRPVMASLYDVEARKDRGEGSVFEAVIGTSKNQVAIAPGALRKTWMENDRRYFHYSTGRPIGGVWECFSANYALHRLKWKNPSADSAAQEVAINIFHHPKHTPHLERMTKSILASLDYYTSEFGRYGFNYLTVVERPAPGTGMHAESAMITHGEGFTTWNPKDDPGSHDHPYAIVAHEMAHQWNVPSAVVEGVPVMSESLAWYYGMKQVEHSKGPAHLAHLLNYMRQPFPYPAIRRGEPLLRGLDPYLSYRRGPFALYALSEYIGDDRVNAALRLLREKHSAKHAPLATTLDLYRELQAVTPDSLRYLLHDLFEVNTYWELKTDRVAVQQKGGGWRVTLDLEADKVVLDSAGRETTVKMDDFIEVGVYGMNEAGRADSTLYLKKHRIHSGKQSIVVQVTHQPVRAGIDPRHLLIDLKAENNHKDISVPSPKK
jgi:ABC-2 type transport system permease protein